MTIDKEALLKPRLPEATVTLEGVGDVRVRGLSRQEAMDVKTAAGDDLQAVEISLLVLGLIDPVLTEDEVKAWYAAAPAGELEPVTEAIAELSGMSADADKQAARNFRR